ncbi:MAG: hypothetical protein WAX77_03770 [Methylococcaceae bacterium]
MSVSFEDFLKSAEELLNNSDSKEIDFRNLISRSYYAMFHLSKEVAQQLNTTIRYEQDKELGSHNEIFIQYKRSSDKNLQQLAKLMYASKTNRVTADYHINQSIERSDAAHHFYAIKAIIKKLQQAKERLE